MLIADIPAKFPIVWGASAGGAYINAIPEASQIGSNPGFASLTDGFPPLNATPIGAGGIPPRIQDWNGILREVTAWNRWAQAGGPITYDAAFQADVGGYPQHAVVRSVATAGKWWRSTVNNNLTDPDAAGAGWVDFFAPVFVSPVFTGNGSIAGNWNVGGTLGVTGAAQVGSFTSLGANVLTGGATTFPSAAGVDALGQMTFNNQLKNTATSFLNPAGAVVTFENSSGAVQQICYSGANAAVAALSIRLQSTSPVMQGFFYGAANVGNITTNGSSTTYGTTSDRRLKNITGLLSGAAERLLKIPVHRFTWKANPDAGEVDGFIADELQLVIPEAVTGQPDQEADVGDLYMTAGTIMRRGLKEEPVDLGEDEEWVEKTGNVRLTRERILAPDQPKHPAADLPDGVHWRKTGTVPIYQNVDQSKVVPLLVAALQEALGRIAALEAAQRA